MMKKIAFLAVLVFSLAFVVGSAMAEKEYVNGIDFGFPPFGFVDKDGKPSGFDVESVNWIAKEMGFKVKHQPMDWDGIIPALTSGKIDFIASGMSATEERAQIVNFTIPYYTVTQVLLVAGDSDKDLEAMLRSDVKLGAQRGTVTEKLLMSLKDNPEYKFEVVPYDSTDLALQDLPIGRIQGSGMDSSIAYEMMKGNDKYRIAGTFDAKPENYAYAVRKEDKELLDSLNEGLKRLMADPYWTELKDKWGVH